MVSLVISHTQMI